MIGGRSMNELIEAEQNRQSQWCGVSLWIHHYETNEVKNGAVDYYDPGFRMNSIKSPAVELVGRTSTSRETWGSSLRRRGRRGWTQHFRCQGMQKAVRR